MFKRFLFGLALAATLAGCASNVNLDDVPVEDRSASTTPSGQGSATTQSDVKSVTLDPNAGAAAGPAGVARIIYFDYDSNVIKQEFQPLIEGHARFLKSN